MIETLCDSDEKQGKVEKHVRDHKLISPVTLETEPMTPEMMGKDDEVRLQ